MNTREEALIIAHTKEEEEERRRRAGVSLVSRAAGKGVFFLLRACWCVVLSTSSSSHLERDGFE